MAKKSFNVIVQDFNRREFVAYDVIPYFKNAWDTMKRSKVRSKELPTDLKGLKEWIKSQSRYHFWSRCEYEVVLSGWPNQDDKRKIDVHEQIMMNLDLVTDIFAECINLRKKNNVYSIRNIPLTDSYDR